MLAHVAIQCADLSRSAAFYDAVLAPLGNVRVMEPGDAIGYGIPPSADFWIGQQQTGDGFRETHIAFLAPDQAAVRAFYEAALATGAESLHEPQFWPEYPRDLLRSLRARSRREQYRGDDPQPRLTPARTQPNVVANWFSTAVHRSCCAAGSVQVAW